MRKNILKYDNVMNDQRKVVFEQRREMMAKDSLEEMIDDMREGVVDDLIAKHVPPDAYPEAWDIEGLAHSVAAAFNIALPLADWAKEEGITEEDMRERLKKAADEAYAARVAKNGPEVTRYIEKQIVLQALDHLWREHLLTLDHLRQVVGWRGMAQRDPLNEYKSEAFQLFDELIARLREATTTQLSRVEVAFESPQAPENATGAFLQAGNAGASFEGPLATAPTLAYHPPAPAFGVEEAGSTATLVRPAQGEGEIEAAAYGKVGRNQPCPCGSGKKYKHCHGALA
jgi:preprotein translocase subunit SecA